MGPPRVVCVAAESRLRALSPHSRPSMAARVAHSSRSGLNNGLDCFGAPHNTQRRVRATSQTRATTSSPRTNAAKARSASAQRVPLFRAATTQSLTTRGPRTVLPRTANPASPLITRANSQNVTPSRATQKNTKPVTTPARPNRGPIVPSNRKASAPPKLVSNSSSLAKGCSNNNSGSCTAKTTPSKASEISSHCDPGTRAVVSSPGRSYRRGTQQSIARSGRVPNSVAVRRKPTPHSNVFLANNPDFCISPCDCHCSSECLRCVADSHRSGDSVDTFTAASDPYNGLRCDSARKSSSSSTDHGNDSNSSKGSLSSSDGSELSSSNASSDSGCSELRITRRNNSNTSPRRTVTTATLTSKTRKATAPVISDSKIRSQCARSPYARSVSQPTSYNSDRKLLRADNDLKPDNIRTPNRETLKARVGYRINVNGCDVKSSLKELDKLGLRSGSNGHLSGPTPALRNGVAPHLQQGSERSSPGTHPLGLLDQSDKFEHEVGFLDDLPGGGDGITDSPVASSPIVLPTVLRISKDHGGSKPSQATELDPASASSGEARKLSAPSVLPAKRGHGRELDGVGSTDPNISHKKDEKSFKPVKFKKMSTATQKDANELIPEEQEAMEVTTACTVQSLNVPAVEVQSVTPLKCCPPQTIVVPARSGSSTFYDKVNSCEVSAKSDSPPVSAMITINSVVPQLSSTATPAVDTGKNAVLDNTKHSLVVEPIAPARRNSKCSKEDEKAVQPPKKTGECVSGVNVEPVKSVSITKLESDVKGDVPKQEGEATKKESNVTADKVVAKVERKISPAKNYWLDSDISISTPAAKSTPVVAPSMKKDAEASTAGAAASDPSRKVSTETKKFAKKDNAAFSDELNVEENAKYAQEKVARLEKMVSDLVKNAEIKKQEIAALKMQIKRLKELVRERGQTSDDDPKSAAKKKIPAAPTSNSNGGSGGSSDTAVAAATATTAAAPSGATERLEELVEENRVLRSQLLHLGGSLNSSRLSDQEKEALLKGGSWGERSTTGATIGDWDNKSSSSEVSVACLQDRIMQMEETHYCTNEELQATLQELDDLREQLAESQAELENMQEEKQVLLASLTQQTNFLSESREQNQTLKQLLIQQSENSQAISSCVNSQKLLELLKSVEEDHERLEMKQEDVEAQLSAAKVAEHRFLQDSQMYRDRMKSLEGLLECSSAAKAAAEAQSAELQEAVKAEKLESSRLQEALTAAKEHMAELEARLVGGGSVSEVLEAVRAENSKLEARVTELTQQLHASSRDSDKMKELVTSLQDKLKHAEESARDGLHDASARSERLQEERRALLQQVASAEKALADAKQTAQRHLQHKRELKTALSESQKLLTQAQQDKQHSEELGQQQKQQFDKQVEEWEQFQCDLLTTVRVANDFKTEVQSQLEKVQQENAVLKHQLATLEKKAANCRVCSGTSKFMSSPSGAGDRRNADRALTRTDSKVKSLIESLENGIPITRGSGRSNTNSCLDSNSAVSIAASSTRKTTAPAAPLLKRADTDGVIRSSTVSSPLKESGNIEPGSPVSPLRSLQRNSLGEGLGSLSSSSPSSKVSVPPPSSPTANLPDTVKMSQLGEKAGAKLISDAAKPISILSNKMETRKSSFNQLGADKKDPLSMLAQGGGSRRNALLKWCQNQTLGYSQVDITNFSSSWSDGLALCAILDTYVPEKINYRTLNHADKRANFEKALAAAESVGIPSTLDVNDMMNSERPNWQTVYNYVTSIYAHFET